MKAKPRIERHVSAGGVVCRTEGGVLEAALCGRDTPRKWSLPKGTPEQGETLEETALREVAEETGLQVAIRGSLGHITYWFALPGAAVRCHKTVHFYLMQPTGGDTTLHDAEFDEVRWFPVAEAVAMLQYPNEADVVERARETAETLQR